MKTYKRNIRKRKLINYAEIAAVVLLVAAIVSVFLFYRTPVSNPEPPKEEAATYFAFQNVGAECYNVSGTGDLIYIKAVYLEMTPIGGNATSLHLEVSGYTDPLDQGLYWDSVLNGTKRYVEFTLSKERLVRRTENGTFPLTISVYCNEAEGDVTLQIPEKNLYRYPPH